VLSGWFNERWWDRLALWCVGKMRFVYKILFWKIQETSVLKNLVIVREIIWKLGFRELWCETVSGYGHMVGWCENGIMFSGALGPGLYLRFCQVGTWFSVYGMLCVQVKLEVPVY
jgi:hypothetical protein